MLKVKRMRVLSAKTIAAFGPQAKAEWTEVHNSRRIFYANLAGLWTISKGKTPLCVIGLRKYTPLGFGGEVVFFLCRELHAHTHEVFRFIRRALRRIVRLWSGLCVRVKDTFWIGHRFVKHFGFSEVEKVVGSDEGNFTLYQLRASWLA
jgi:hypothetical protein